MLTPRIVTETLSAQHRQPWHPPSAPSTSNSCSVGPKEALLSEREKKLSEREKQVESREKELLAERNLWRKKLDTLEMQLKSK